MQVTREFSPKVARWLNQAPEEQLNRIAEEQLDEEIPVFRRGNKNIKLTLKPVVPSDNSMMASDIVMEHRKQDAETL